ncbi:MAG TPA: metallophosphoesterase [Bacteroidales bacterium]|nr:metallophosphoesterase [Bacteroidales bacterium]
MKKIIHLSDLHDGHEECGVHFRTIIDNINFLKQPAVNYIVVITGDLCDNANKTEQVEEAFNAIETLKEYGYRVLVIPGNHDYGTGSLGDERFVSLFSKRYYGYEEVSYPRLDIIDEMAFIGLDSTAEELHWRDRILSEGELGKSQLKRLDKILKDPKVVSRKKIVYLHHHPFDFRLGMQLKDSKALRKVIEKRIDMLLFGHYHLHPGSAGKIFHGVWGIPRCYNAGTSTHKNGENGLQRVIDLSSDDPRIDYDGNFL